MTREWLDRNARLRDNLTEGDPMSPTPRLTARQMLLSAELRRLREESGMSRQDAMDSLGWSPTKISRIENGKVSVDLADVEAAIELYGGVGEADYARLIKLATDGSRRGWWDAYKDVFKSALPAMEDTASWIWTFEPLIIPGLLQTGEYARALINASPLPGQDGDRRVQGRTARQAVVTRANAPDLHFVVGEAVLHQQVGGPSVMRGQLSSLWESAHRDNITIQVVPFATGAHFGLEGGFTVFGFSDPDVKIARTEGPGGSIYLESVADLKEIDQRRRGIMDVALTSAESVELFRQHADQY